MSVPPVLFCFFFFNDTATTEIYTLSLHDALPISISPNSSVCCVLMRPWRTSSSTASSVRSEEHTSELQSRLHLVCRLLLEKKKNRSTCITLAPGDPRHGSAHLPRVLACQRTAPSD